MQTASLEHCKELFELSSWGMPYNGKDDLQVYVNGKVSYTQTHSYNWGKHIECPAYHLGYLLRRLPHKTRIERFDIAGHPDKRKRLYDHTVWNCYLFTAQEQHWKQADSPEDAACKLAIELFKTGILKREDSHDEK